MSGGHFDYIQYRFDSVVEQLEDLEHKCNDKKEDEFYYKFDQRTKDLIRELKLQTNLVRNKIHALDYFISGDTGEQDFIQECNKSNKEWEERYV